jgi:hypothetical protein
MYGLAYVMLRLNFSSLQREVELSLAPFERGGDDRFPQGALTFSDATPSLRRLHSAAFEYKGGAIYWDLNIAALSPMIDLALAIEHLNALGFDGFSGTFSEIEPDFDSFVVRFSHFRQRDSKTGKYGSWINPLGRWDWWELGGRYNGVITGEKLPASDARCFSSGPHAGRDTLQSALEAFGGAAPNAEAWIEANVELSSTLLSRLDAGEKTLPAALVLPIGSAPDTARWLDGTGWHEISQSMFSILGVSAEASFADLVRIAYSRFAGHAVAAVAYHC